VQKVHGALRGALHQVLQHRHHGGDADASADEYRRHLGLIIEHKVTHGWGHVDQVALLDLGVQHVRHHAGRRGRLAALPGFALDRDAQGLLARRGRQTVLARLVQAQLGHRHAHAHILPRHEAGHRAAVGRHQVERSDLITLGHLALHAKAAPACPAAGLGGSGLVQAFFHAAQQLGQLAVGGGPGGDQLIGGGLSAQHLADRGQQVFADDGVVLAADAQAHVLVRDQLQHRGQHTRVVDVFGIGRHRHGQGLLLCARSLVALVEDGLELGVVLEHAGIKVAGQGHAVLLEHGGGGFDEGAGLGV